MADNKGAEWSKWKQPKQSNSFNCAMNSQGYFNKRNGKIPESVVTVTETRQF
jgi:hypothetical protein